jgi:hypothetical protein
VFFKVVWLLQDALLWFHWTIKKNLFFSWHCFSFMQKKNKENEGKINK